MVFIEERQKYLISLTEQPKQMALFALLSDQSFQNPIGDVSETDVIYYTCVQAIKSNSKEEFNKQYDKISKRKVSENTVAPFVHDDFLIFTLIIGVSKFNSNIDWLLGVIRSRAKNETTTSFENLLTGNYQSKANIQSLVLIFQFLLDKSKISNEILIGAYDSMCNIKQLHNNDFIRIIQYRAFDIIIQFKLPRDTDEISRLLEFETIFKKRITIFSYFAYNSLLILLLFFAYKILQTLPEELKLKINDIGIIIGVGGVGLLGNIIPKWKEKFKELLLKLFGYKANNH